MSKHTGPVTVRFNDPQGRYTVLCPVGHLVTGGTLGPDFAGSSAAARISSHQAAQRHVGALSGLWTVECDGAV